MVTDNELIMKALGVCHALTYNEEPQGSAKHMLRELAHRLEKRSARTITCDQVAWMLNAIGRFIPADQAPAVSRAREMQKYALLYELMEVADLKFEDDAAAGNATPRDVQMLRPKPFGLNAARNPTGANLQGSGVEKEGQ